MILKIGQKAPSFKLFNTEKKEISLEQFKGQNVVLLFFPMAFTGVCTTELCSVRDDLASYNNLNAQVLGISVNSLFTLAKFKEEQKLNFPLLSDFNKETTGSFGVLFKEFVFGMKGVAKRSVFVIDADGVIQHTEVLESAGDLPNFNTVKETLAKLKVNTTIE